MWRVLLVCALVLGTGCSASAVQQQQQSVVSLEDTGRIEAMADAITSAWANSLHPGLIQQDVKVMRQIFKAVEEFHADGSVIDMALWRPALREKVPAKYQDVSIVLVGLLSIELNRHGVQKQPISEDVMNDGMKILIAVEAGALAAMERYVGVMHT